MAIGDVFRVAISQRLHGQLIVNTLFYRCSVSDGTDSNDATKLLASINAAIIPAFKACQSAELAHEFVVVQKIWPAPVQMAVFDSVGAGAGSVAGSSLPTSVAVVLTKTTAFAGPKYRGRTYLAGIPSSYESDSKLNTANAAAFHNLGDLINDSLVNAGDTFTPILWHRASSTYTVLTNYVLRLSLRNQRRRQIGVGQ